MQYLKGYILKHIWVSPRRTSSWDKFKRCRRKTRDKLRRDVMRQDKMVQTLDLIIRTCFTTPNIRTCIVMANRAWSIGFNVNVETPKVNLATKYLLTNRYKDLGIFNLIWKCSKRLHLEIQLELHTNCGNFKKKIALGCANFKHISSFCTSFTNSLCDKPNLKITQKVDAFENLHSPCGILFQNNPQGVYEF